MSLFRQSISRLTQRVASVARPDLTSRDPEVPDWVVQTGSADPDVAAPPQSEAESHAVAQRLLVAASSSMMPLTEADAGRINAYLEFQEFPAGARIIEEGDGRNTDFVSLLLAGEVRIETTLNPGLDPQTFNVMGPGTVMGVVGFMDGLPRWGSHTALSPIVCAILTRSRLKALIEDDPMLGAKFLLAMAQKLAEVQRDQIARLKVYAQINRSLQDEIREAP